MRIGFARRHCEPTGRANARPMTGSAKQSISPLAETWIASSLTLLAMTYFKFQTARGRASAFPRRARALLRLPPSENKRAQGKPDARCTRGLVCKNGRKRTRAYRSSGGNPAFPARWFTAYTALSSVTGLSCHRRRRDTSRQLDASVGAPGPHGFAVRGNGARQSPSSRPPHPTARFVTIASRPSHRVRQANL